MTERPRVNPIDFELVQHALGTIVDEMAMTIIRTAYSHPLKEAMDFATAICDRQGQLVAQGPSLPLHMGSMPEAMDAVMRHFGDRIAPGDVYILNDPYDGGMHLPDIFLIKPYFIGERLLAFFATTAHHADVGGRVPGSMAYDSTDIYQEGFRFPPLKLYDRGEENETLFTLLRCNSRVPEKVMGDLRAQLATCFIGQSRLDELVGRYGADELERHFVALQDYSEALARAEIRKIPSGVYEYEDFIDGDGVDSGPIRLRVRIDVRDEEVEVDFAGSAPQVRGAINPTFSYVRSTVYACLRCVMETAIPNNSGYFRPIKITAPLGSILNPRHPAACAMRGQTTYRLEDAIFGALAQALPDRVFAAGEGGTSSLRISGEDRAKGRFIFMDAIQGTWGARPNKDGVDGVGNLVTNLSNTPAEIIESEHPVRLRRYCLVPDSGGPGRFRGGMSVLRELELLAEEGELQLRSDRQDYPPFGLAGGRHGASARSAIVSRGNVHELPSKTTVQLKKGDAIRHQQAGGGGHGDPFTRDPALVWEDVLNEKVSLEGAKRDYGVVIDPVTLRVDEDETQLMRSRR